MGEHPIHRISEREAEIFHEEDGMVLAEIDEDEDEDIPIFAVSLENGSHTVFYFREEEDGIRVLYIRTDDDTSGEMTEMMDFICNRFGVTTVEFFNVASKDLLHTLDNPSTRTKKIDDPNFDGPQKVLMAEVEWQT